MHPAGHGEQRPRRDLATLWRFIAAGFVNTGASLMVYWLLLTMMPPQPAYALCFAAGIVLSYFLNTGIVFRARRSWSRFLAFPLIYAIGYAAGALVLALAVRAFGIDARIAPLLSLCVTWPLMFVLMRRLLRHEPG